jgi:predicted  nucleic acid-binding Zn-ribbon protein
MKKLIKSTVTFIRSLFARLIYLILGRSAIVKEVKALTHRVKDLSREKEILDSEIKALSGNFTDLSTMKRALETEIYKLEQEKTALQTKIQTERQELLALQKHVQQVTEIKEAQTNQVQQLREKVADLEDLYQSLQGKINELKSEYNLIKNELDCIKKQIITDQKTRNDLQKNIINYNKEIALKNTEIKDINNFILTNSQELTKINNDINELEKERKKLIIIFTNNKERNEILTRKIEERQQQLDILEKKINNYLEHKNKVAKEINSYTENKENLSQEISNLEEKKQALELLIKKLEADTIPVEEPKPLIIEVLQPPVEIDEKQRKDYISILWLRDIEPHWQDKNKPEGERYLGNINLSRDISEMILDVIALHLKGFESINREALDNYFKGKDWRNNNWINTFTFALSEYAYYYRRDRFWQGFCDHISINHSLAVENTLREITRDGIQQLGLIQAEDGYEYVSTLKLQHRWRENPPLITVKPPVKEIIPTDIKLFLDIEDSGDILLMLPSQELWETSWEELRGSEVSIPQEGWRGIIPDTGNLEIPELSTPIREIAEEWCWQLTTNDGEILSHWRCVGCEKDFPFLMFDYWTGDRIPLLDNLSDKEEIICFIPNSVELSYSEEIELIEDCIPSSISGWEGIQLALTDKKGQIIINTIQETRTIEWDQSTPEETESTAKPQLRGIKLKEKEDIYLETLSLWYPPISHPEIVNISVNNLKNYQFYSKKIELNSNSQWQEIPLGEWINSEGEYSLTIETEGNNYSWSPKFKLSSQIQIADKLTSLLDIEIDNDFITKLPLKVDSAEEFWTKQITITNLWTLEEIIFCLDNGKHRKEKFLQADSSGKLSFSLATLRDVLPESNYYLLSYKRQGESLNKLIEIENFDKVIDDFNGDKPINMNRESSLITYYLSIFDRGKKRIFIQEFTNQIRVRNIHPNSIKLSNESTIRELILITVKNEEYTPILQDILAELEVNPRLRIRLNLTLREDKRR